MKQTFKVISKYIIDIVIIVLLIYLSIKKGGFYKIDILMFTLLIEILGIFRIGYKYFKNRYNLKFDYVGALLLLLSVSYLLPIIFNNYSSLNDSIVEFIRYFNMYIIYKLVSFSDNKKIYKTGIIVIGVVLGIFGIDGLGLRLLEQPLKLFNSGYLDIDLTRMSSTIQYANVFAILLLIASIFSFEKLIRNFKSINNKEKKFSLKILKTVICYMITIFLLVCIVLSKSRMVMLFTIGYYIFDIICSKRYNFKSLFTIILSILEIIICSTLILKYMYINQVIIYVIAALSVILSGVIYYFLIVFLDNKNVDDFIKNNQKKIVISLVSLLGIYILCASLISTQLKVSSSSKEPIKRSIYNFNENAENSIKFSIRDEEVDSRYKVTIYRNTQDNKKEVVKTFEYYDMSSGNFETKVNLAEDTKNITIEFDCYKGKIKVEDFKLNGKNVALDYALFPGDILEKIKDSIHGADSVTSRGTYLKDAFKIWNLSFSNKLIGTGGEGFNNTYQMVQSEKYISTEVHNSFVQILVESGLIGFFSIITAIVLYILKYKNNTYKISLIVLVLHSIIDLDFSYMIILAVFAILLGANEKKGEQEEITSNFAYIETHVQIVLSMLLLIVSAVITFRFNLAYRIDTEKKDEMTVVQDLELGEKLEKKVSLDSSDNNYRRQLNSEYNGYLHALTKVSFGEDDKDVKEQIKNIVLNIENNAILMQTYEKKDKVVLCEVANTYFDNLENLVDLNYRDNKEKGYEYYLNKIKKNILFVEENYKYNDIAKELVSNAYKKYYEGLQKIEIKNKVIKENINYFYNKVYNVDKVSI